jgi:hypothetical protein
MCGCLPSKVALTMVFVVLHLPSRDCYDSAAIVYHSCNHASRAVQTAPYRYNWFVTAAKSLSALSVDQPVSAINAQALTSMTNLEEHCSCLIVSCRTCCTGHRVFVCGLKPVSSALTMGLRCWNHCKQLYCLNTRDRPSPASQQGPGMPSACIQGATHPSCEHTAVWSTSSKKADTTV